MNIKKKLILVYLILLSFSFAMVTQASTPAHISILNTDESLGIFRDLTVAEVKNYYKDLDNGLKGEELLSSLQPILKNGQIKLQYSSGDTSSSNWSGYYLLERDWKASPLTETEIKTQKYSKSGIWVDILYSTSNIYLSNGINSGSFKYYDLDTNEEKTVSYKNGSTQFDREHVFPKSFGFNGKGDGYKKLTAGCDMQNLHAGEHNGNSSGHSNYPYGNVVKKDASTAIFSGITGEIIGYTGLNKNGIKVFEPLDVDKGDIARTIFYMCARYHTYEELGGGDNTPALTLSDSAESRSTLSPEDTKDNPSAYGELSDLLEWNKLDPVNEFEIHRNNLCYNAIQKNRNPFIDYPEWVDIAFGNSTTGIDKDTYTGTENSTQSPKLDLVTNINPIYAKSSLDLTTLKFNFVENGEAKEVSLDNLSYEVYYNNENQNVTDLANYKFNNKGTYKIEFTYISNGKSYSCNAEIVVNPNYTLNVKNNNISIKEGNSIDFNTLSVVLLHHNTEINEITDYQIEIYDSAGNLVSTDKNYSFGFGKYSIKLSSTYDGEEAVYQFDINVGLAQYKIYIIVAIVVIVLIIALIIFIKQNNKKKKRKANKKKSKKTTNNTSNKASQGKAPGKKAKIK